MKRGSFKNLSYTFNFEDLAKSLVATLAVTEGTITPFDLGKPGNMMRAIGNKQD